MAKTSVNLGLIIPEQTDFYNVGVHETNYERIDEEFGKNATNTDELRQEITEHLEESKQWVALWKTQIQTILNETPTHVVWDDIYNGGNADYATLENGKIKLDPGVYLILANIGFGQGNVGIRSLSLEDVYTSVGASDSVSLCISTIGVFDGFIDCLAEQKSGASLDLTLNCGLRIVRLGDA